MVDLNALADNLVQIEPGFWRARSLSKISYPEDGNTFCYQVEETSFWFRHRNRIILRVLQAFPPPGPLFDIGGGNGFVAMALNRAGFETVLVEPGEGVQNARRRGLPLVVHSTLQDAGFRPGALPAVGLFDVLEHIEDDIGFLQTLARLMPPGGRLYLTVPAFSWLWSVVDKDSGHHRRYSRSALTRRLQKAEFSIEYFSGFFFIHHLAHFSPAHLTISS
ncbi:MAG: class I SAM-dependent methyltransferase [Anaerolineales bacterium]|nr:class I SAM-dependent methyltransferase [Anaerolineales bacterium]